MKQAELNYLFDHRQIKSDLIKYMKGEPQIHTGLLKIHDILLDWLNGEYHLSKRNRLDDIILNHDLMELSAELILQIATLSEPMLLVTVASMFAPKLKMDTFYGIYTAAELIAVACDADLWDVNKPPHGSAMVVPRFDLPEVFRNRLMFSCYMPPYIGTKPPKLKNNRDSIYTCQIGTSLILGGKHNHHDSNLCLDVLNKQNHVKYSINEEFISSVEEHFTKDESEYTEEQLKRVKDNWHRFKSESYMVYTLLLQTGNHFYLEHRVDKRGRIYSQGYHVNPQGSSFKKAMLDLAKKENIAIPEEYLCI